MPVRIFITYTHDTEEHREWVGKLADDLQRQPNLEVEFDEYDLYGGKDLTHFMERVRTSDRAIVVVTDNYVKRSEDRMGGAGYESNVITAQLLESPVTDKFIPVFRQGNAVPSFLASKTWLDFRDDHRYERSLEELLRAIRKQSARPRPTKLVGESPTGQSSPTQNEPVSATRRRIRLSLEACDTLNDEVHLLVEAGKWNYTVPTAYPDELLKAESEFMKSLSACASDLRREADEMDEKFERSAKLHGLLGIAGSASDAPVRDTLRTAATAVENLKGIRTPIRQEGLTAAKLREHPLYVAVAKSLNAIVDAGEASEAKKRSALSLLNLFSPEKH